jgi:hypothetical protein
MGDRENIPLLRSLWFFKVAVVYRLFATTRLSLATKSVAAPNVTQTFRTSGGNAVE